MNNRFANIDDVLKASDIVRLLEELELKSEERIKSLIRSDGIAKKGKAMAVLASSQQKYAAFEVLRLIDEELKKSENTDGKGDSK